ncbi:DUF2255 family protein [Dactylosporangium sp. CA-092794]|uniref:DUF2255 family protein n=1 Tax=Dactylosporangium sp. CA-092794 TaxID=3239929 RepID=UPI003D8E9F26
MHATWSPHELEQIDAAGELHIAVKRADGSLRPWTPIWVVCADDQVFVRTWYQRDTGWYGHALRSHRARIRVPGSETDVTIDDVGEGPADLRDAIDAAYRDKYGSSGSSTMVGATAAATTLRLAPERETRPPR